ncbi:MAG TPA: hypothetical protein VFB79_21045 [Candidatus Angelobacter sp.]|nr:hypothetical protein [Candidatus Angelobacter sp.]
MKRFLLFLTLISFSSFAFAQQDYVPRYDAFAGFSYLNSPRLNLAERGFDGEFGINLNRWLALGGDYSIFTGHSDIRASDLKPALQAQLIPLLPLLGPNPAVPFDSTTYTFTFGPQINFRQLKWVTFFVRPAIGGMHETATLKPNTPALILVTGQLAPSGRLTDLKLFYGAGGGFDLNATKHFGIRFAADFVHVNLFDNLLNEGRNSVRLAIGPKFRFGRNMAER